MRLSARTREKRGGVESGNLGTVTWVSVYLTKFQKMTYDRSDERLVSTTSNTRAFAMRKPAVSMESNPVASPRFEADLPELEKMLELGEDELRVLLSVGC